MVLNRQRRIRVALKPLAEFLLRVQQTLERTHQEVTVCLVSDAAMARLNRFFRRKTGSTDVLSFPAEDLERRARRNRRRAFAAGFPPNGRFARVSPPQLGDIAISPATALRTAHRAGRSLASELRILILHGMLHLVGYDHETDDGTMVRVERRLRRQFGLS